MFPSGGVAPLAQRQLAAWQRIAAGWVTFTEEQFERCGTCGQAVTRLADAAGRAYSYTGEQRLALTVAHLRQAHPGLDPDPPVAGS